MIKKIICCIIYLALLLIVMYSTMNFIAENHHKENKQVKVPVYFSVIDVLEYKKVDKNIYVTKFLVQINDHIYIMIQKSNGDNVVFKHYKECNYCFNQEIKDYNNFSFSIYDNLDTQLMYKLEKMKNNY